MRTNKGQNLGKLEMRSLHKPWDILKNNTFSEKEGYKIPTYWHYSVACLVCKAIKLILEYGATEAGNTYNLSGWKHLEVRSLSLPTDWDKSNLNSQFKMIKYSKKLTILTKSLQKQMSKIRTPRTSGSRIAWHKNTINDYKFKEIRGNPKLV